METTKLENHSSKNQTVPERPSVELQIDKLETELFRLKDSVINLAEGLTSIFLEQELQAHLDLLNEDLPPHDEPMSHTEARLLSQGKQLVKITSFVQSLTAHHRL